MYKSAGRSTAEPPRIWPEESCLACATVACRSLLNSESFFSDDDADADAEDYDGGD